MLLTNKVRKAIRNPGLAAKAITTKILNVYGSRNFRRFIVLTRSRTGSNMLVSFLNSHPNIGADGEIFARLNEDNYKETLRKAYAKQTFQIKAKGFKIFYYHPLDGKKCEIWNDLRCMKDLHVIHLKRRNILRTLISRKIAGKNDIWANNNTEKKDPLVSKSVSFEINELKSEFEQTRRWEQSGDEMFQNQKLLTIYYEDLVNETESNFKRVLEFLGVPYSKPFSNLRKQNPEKICDLVTNYIEIKTAFEGTKWQDFFENETV